MKSLLILFFLILFSCRQPQPVSCKKPKIVKEFSSYLKSVNIKKNIHSDNGNISFEVFAKYQLKDSIYISALKDAIVLTKPKTNNQMLLTDDNGKISLKITPGKLKYKISYYGYNYYTDSLKIDPGKYYQIKVVLGAHE